MRMVHWTEAPLECLHLDGGDEGPAPLAVGGIGIEGLLPLGIEILDPARLLRRADGVPERLHLGIGQVVVGDEVFIEVLVFQHARPVGIVPHGVDHAHLGVSLFGKGRPHLLQGPQGLHIEQKGAGRRPAFVPGFDLSDKGDAVLGIDGVGEAAGDDDVVGPAAFPEAGQRLKDGEIGIAVFHPIFPRLPRRRGRGIAPQGVGQEHLGRDVRRGDEIVQLPRDLLRRPVVQADELLPVPEGAAGGLHIVPHLTLGPVGGHQELVDLSLGIHFSEIIGKRHQMSDEQEHKKEVGCDVPPVSLGSGFLRKIVEVLLPLSPFFSGKGGRGVCERCVNFFFPLLTDSSYR